MIDTILRDLDSAAASGRAYTDPGECAALVRELRERLTVVEKINAELVDDLRAAVSWRDTYKPKAEALDVLEVWHRDCPKDHNDFNFHRVKLEISADGIRGCVLDGWNAALPNPHFYVYETGPSLHVAILSALEKAGAQ